MKLTLIVAADLDDCIGRGNDIPWHIPSDLKRFKELTSQHACILGSKTHDSIVRRLGKPLPNRRSYVISRTQHGTFADGRYLASPNAAVEAVRDENEPSNCEAFVIGGAQIYEALLPEVSKILITRVHTRVDGDTFMPQSWLGGFMQTSADGAILRDPRDEFESSYTTYERWHDHG
ncbi:MAG: dihydrofolate reductase [Candidatus Saccharibacteria bacterium]